MGSNILGLKSKVFLAPMAGITDYPMRKVVAKRSVCNLYSEMVAINAINRKNKKTYRIADVSNEPYPVIVQLVGNDPELFSESAKLVSELGAYSLDINMGCPVKKIVGNNSGSALMKDLSLASKIIEATVKATELPVSVKFRKGWDINSVNAVEFAKMCQDSGAAYITVHGRTRAQGYSGVADWDIIREVKESVSIPVIGNGDIKSCFDAKRMLDETNCDAVMIGRGCLGNPWLIKECVDYLENGTLPKEITVEEKIDMIKRHIKLLKETKCEKLALLEIRSHATWYLKGVKNSSNLRSDICHAKSTDELVCLLDDFLKEKKYEC